MPEISTQCEHERQREVPNVKEVCTAWQPSGSRGCIMCVCGCICLLSRLESYRLAQQMTSLAQEELISLACKSLPPLILFSVVVSSLPHSLDSVLGDYLLSVASLNTDTEHNNPLYYHHLHSFTTYI